MNKPKTDGRDFDVSHYCRASTLAERTAVAVMMRLGFRDPWQHSKWKEVVESAQRCIDQEIEAMGQIAVRDAIPPIRKVLEYEIRSSLWARWVRVNWIQKMASRYFVWKTKRKYAAYVKSMQIRDHLLKMVNQLR